MNLKINQIETKIVEIRTELSTWTNQITYYQALLENLTKQLTEIKSKIKND